MQRCWRNQRRSPRFWFSHWEATAATHRDRDLGGGAGLPPISCPSIRKDLATVRAGSNRPPGCWSWPQETAVSQLSSALWLVESAGNERWSLTQKCPGGPREFLIPLAAQWEVRRTKVKELGSLLRNKSKNSHSVPKSWEKECIR